jgi:hypothetical protein
LNVHMIVEVFGGWPYMLKHADTACGKMSGRVYMPCQNMGSKHVECKNM